MSSGKIKVYLLNSYSTAFPSTEYHKSPFFGLPVYEKANFPAPVENSSDELLDEDVPNTKAYKSSQDPLKFVIGKYSFHISSAYMSFLKTHLFTLTLVTKGLTLTLNGKDFPMAIDADKQAEFKDVIICKNMLYVRNRDRQIVRYDLKLERSFGSNKRGKSREIAVNSPVNLWTSSKSTIWAISNLFRLHRVSRKTKHMADLFQLDEPSSRYHHENPRDISRNRLQCINDNNVLVFIKEMIYSVRYYKDKLHVVSSVDLPISNNTVIGVFRNINWRNGGIISIGGVVAKRREVKITPRLELCLLDD